MNISEHAEGMLSYKESLGFSRNSYDYYLRDFCDYFSQNDYSQFTEETVLPWCVRRPTEMPEGFRRRITPLRECIFRRFRTSILFSAGQRPHGFGQISLSFHNSISHKRRTGCPAADSFHDPCTPAPQERHSIQPFTLQPTLSFLKTGYLCIIRAGV